MLQNVELPFCIYLISLQTCTSNGLPTGSSILYHWEPCLPVMWLQPLRSLTRMAMVSLASLNLLMHLGISNQDIHGYPDSPDLFWMLLWGFTRIFCCFFFCGGGWPLHTPGAEGTQLRILGWCINKPTDVKGRQESGHECCYASLMCIIIIIYDRDLDLP